LEIDRPAAGLVREIGRRGDRNRGGSRKSCQSRLTGLGNPCRMRPSSFWRCLPTSTSLISTLPQLEHVSWPGPNCADREMIDSTGRDARTQGL